MLRRGRERPFALRQAKGRVLFDDVGCRGLISRHWRMASSAASLCWAAAHDRGRSASRPLSHIAWHLPLTGAARLTAVATVQRRARCRRPLRNPAKIDVSRHEIRIQRDRLVERRRGRGLVLHLAGQRRAIEMRHIELRMAAIVIYPGLIELARGWSLSGIRKIGRCSIIRRAGAARSRAIETCWAIGLFCHVFDPAPGEAPGMEGNGRPIWLRKLGQLTLINS